MSDIARQLLLTADERLWPAGRPVLFLGEWCKLYARKSVWQGMDACTVPHPWKDFVRFSADYDYLKSLYERLLPRLADQLNQMHGTRHGERYWRILIGPWLATFMHIACERWTVLTAALEGWNIDAVACPGLVPHMQVPLHMNDLHERAASDNWNGFLYAAILQSKGVKVCSEVGAEAPELVPATETPRRASMTQRMLGALSRGYSRLFTRARDVFMISTYVPLERLVWMQLGLRQFPIRAASVAVEQVPLNPQRRRWRLECAADNAFEAFLFDMLPQQMPRVYNEGYCRLLEQVAARPWPASPRSIFTSNALWGDEVTMAYTAAVVEAGTALLHGQHGGLYGVGAFSWAEAHESAISDLYVTWGWTESPIEKFAPVGYFKRQLATGWQDDPQGYLTLVCYDFPRYTHRLDSEALVMQSGFIENCLEFGRSLHGGVRDKLLIRLTPRESGWYQESRWKDQLPEVAVDRGQQSMRRLMLASRLLVYTYNSTGFLEAFVSGIPCIMFWDPDVSRLRPAATPYFNDLKAVGILHESPQEAAAHVLAVWDNVAGWWGSPPVQAALRRFCSMYCLDPDVAHTKLHNFLKK
jgi:putative transferase (TIGR04331 family)